MPTIKKILATQMTRQLKRTAFSHHSDCRKTELQQLAAVRTIRAFRLDDVGCISMLPIVSKSSYHADSSLLNSQASTQEAEACLSLVASSKLYTLMVFCEELPFTPLFV